VVFVSNHDVGPARKALLDDPQSIHIESTTVRRHSPPHEHPHGWRVIFYGENHWPSSAIRDALKKGGQILPGVSGRVTHESERHALQPWEGLDHLCLSRQLEVPGLNVIPDRGPVGGHEDGTDGGPEGRDRSRLVVLVRDASSHPG
jgi:hypothetical protein